MPVIREIPGSVAGDVVAGATTRDQIGIGVFAGTAGADASTRIAAAWGPQSGAAGVVEGDPPVAEGVIGIVVGPA